MKFPPSDFSDLSVKIDVKSNWPRIVFLIKTSPTEFSAAYIFSALLSVINLALLVSTEIASIVNFSSFSRENSPLSSGPKSLQVAVTPCE